MYNIREREGCEYMKGVEIKVSKKGLISMRIYERAGNKCMRGVGMKASKKGGGPL